MAVGDSMWSDLERSFEQVELGPDAEWNATLSPDSIRAKLEALRVQDAEQTRKLNAEFAEMGSTVEMIPLYGIPPALWGHPNGIRFHTHLRLTPYENWNRIHLPSSERGAWVIRTFPHPGELEWLEGNALAMLADFLTEFDAVKVEPGASSSRAQLEAWRDVRQTLSTKVENTILTTLMLLGEKGAAGFKEEMSKREKTPNGTPVFRGEVAAESGPPRDPSQRASPVELTSLMTFGLVETFLLVAGADGEIDKKELAGFGKSAQRHLSQHSEFAAVMQVLSTRFSQISDQLSCSNSAPLEHLKRFVEAARDGLGPEMSLRARKLVYFVGHEVAHASGGGLLGMGSKISKAEERALGILARALRLE